MSVMKKSKAKKGTMKRILSYIKPYKKQIIGAMLTAILYVVLNLTTPVLIGQAIDKAIGKGNVDFQAMLNIIGLIMLTVIGSAFFQWLMSLFTNTVSYMTVRDMRRDIFAKFNEVPLKYIDGHPHGDLISRVINDIDAVGDGLLQGVEHAMEDAKENLEINFAANVQPGDYIVAGKNFGCGSSREHAPVTLSTAPLQHPRKITVSATAFSLWLRRGLDGKMFLTALPSPRGGKTVPFTAGRLELGVLICQVLQLRGAHKGEVGGIEEKHAPLSQYIRLGNGVKGVILVALDREIGNFFLNQGHRNTSIHNFTG